MRRIKLVLLLSGGIIVLCLSLIAIVLAAFDNDDYRKLAIWSVRRFAGCEMMIDGPFTLDRSLEPSLSAKGIRFASVPDGAPLPLTSIEHLNLKVALLPLLSGKIIIRQLLVDDAKISFYSGGGEKEAKPEAAGKQPDIVIPILESVTLRNLDLTVTAKDTGRVERLFLRQFKVDEVHDTGFLSVKGEGALNANDFRIEGRLGALAGIFEAARPYPVELKLNVADFMATVSGTVLDPVRGKGMKFQLAGEEPELANLLNALQVDVPPLGRLKFEATLSGDANAPRLSNLNLTVSDGSQLELTAKGSITNVISGEGADILLSGVCRKKDILRMITPGKLLDANAFRFKGNLHSEQGDYTVGGIDAAVTTDKNLEIKAGGSLRFGRRETGETVGDVDLKLRITAPNMGAVAPLLGASLLPDLGPVQADAQVTGTTELLSLENIAITAGQPGRVHMEWRGRIGKVPLSGAQTVSDVRVSAAIEAANTSAFASLAGISVPDLGPLRGSWRVVDRKGRLDIETFELRAGSRAKATFLMKGRATDIRNPKRTGVSATFESASQPWLAMWLQRPVTESHPLKGSIRLTGSPTACGLTSCKSQQRAWGACR